MLVIAANDPEFGGNVAADLAGTFLLAGIVMVTISVPLLIIGIAGGASMRWLGRYWKRIQAIGTYLVWGILGIICYCWKDWLMDIRRILRAGGYWISDCMSMWRARYRCCYSGCLLCGGRIGCGI